MTKDEKREREREKEKEGKKYLEWINPLRYKAGQQLPKDNEWFGEKKGNLEESRFISGFMKLFHN